MHRHFLTSFPKQTGKLAPSTMSLWGQLIQFLETCDEGRSVVFDIYRGDDSHSPGALMSYRGFYADLAFDRARGVSSVGELLAECRKALGKKYNGYKGGEFEMGSDTPLWVAYYGCTGDAIVDVSLVGSVVVLKTKSV